VSRLWSKARAALKPPGTRVAFAADSRFATRAASLGAGAPGSPAATLPRAVADSSRSVGVLKPPQPQGRSSAAALPFLPVAPRAGRGPAPTGTTTIRHSPLAPFCFGIRRLSPLAAHPSLLAAFSIRYSPFAILLIRYSRLAVSCRSLLANVRRRGARAPNRGA
jgi:hypothetical protein